MARGQRPHALLLAVLLFSGVLALQLSLLSPLRLLTPEVSSGCAGQQGAGAPAGNLDPSLCVLYPALQLDPASATSAGPGHSQPGSRDQRTGPRTAVPVESSPGNSAPATSLPSLPPRVALLFLLRGPLPLEPIWRAFLQGAAALVPPELAAALRADRTGSPGSNPVEAWEALFALHAHPAPGYTFRPGSLLAGREVAEGRRVAVQWGQHSVVRM